MTATAERDSLQLRQRVFLVDDHPLVREWLANVINQQEDLTVCGESEGRENYRSYPKEKTSRRHCRYFTQGWFGS